jgi:hypothetical protein
VNLTTESLKIAQRIVKIFDTERKSLDMVNEQYPVGSRIPAELNDHLMGWKISTDVLTGWESIGRQVLSIHPELLRSLRFSGSSTIEPAVFRTLPYFNPMVVFPDPPPLFSHTKNESMRLLGFICYAKTPIPERITDTHDPSAYALGAELVIEIINADGSRAVECDYISFPMEGKAFTLKESVEDILSRFKWSHGGQDRAVQEKFMRDIIKVTVGSIMYLCSTTLEAEKVPRKTVLKSLNPVPRKPFSFYRVGWQIGAALSRHRAAIEVEDPSQQPKPGYEQDPQHRKAHFKTVWTGPRSMIPRTVFIAPYWTHLEKLGVKGVNTVRKVVID